MCEPPTEAARRRRETLRAAAPDHGRRDVLLGSLATLMLGACSSPPRGRVRDDLPAPPWGVEAGGRELAGGERLDVPTEPVRPPTSSVAGPVRGVRPRAAWGAQPTRLSDVNPMLPPRFVTVHHDAIAVSGARLDEAACASRIRGIQAFHQGDRGWADIGYHYVIDPSGRVWQGRELRHQGAHVRLRNEGNVGVVLMGDFEVERPTRGQLVGLRQVLGELMGRYRIPVQRVLTHGEWPDAATECPGRTLQSSVVAMRREELGRPR